MVGGAFYHWYWRVGGRAILLLLLKHISSIEETQAFERSSLLDSLLNARYQMPQISSGGDSSEKLLNFFISRTASKGVRKEISRSQRIQKKNVGRFRKLEMSR